jgi:putative YphP/YqiW family bacilliredoxin
MFNVVSRPPMYDQEAVQHMRDELTAVGFTELLTAQDVQEAVEVKDDKVVLVFINSVCGCAAGSARPAVSLALQNDRIPDNIYTVFAGQERDAVDKVRSYVKAYPPSSPSVAMFKNGELVFFLQRYDIEGRSTKAIASDLLDAFNEICTAQGPSVPAEQYEQVVYAKSCGSKIPLYNKNK